MTDLLNKAQGVYPEVVSIRRDIHAHPEVGFTETRTSALVKAKLEEYGVDTVEQLTGTSIVATIKGTKGEGKCIALRCDMDALPVKEATGLPFASENEGVMHACGHDLHTSMMLGNAKLLCEMRDEFAGTVKLIFQSGEEVQPGGAKALVEAGVMEGVDAIVGMHVSPDADGEEYGKVCLKKGSMTSAADPVEVEIEGVGGHSSTPHLCKDPVLAASQFVVLLQQLQARYSDAKQAMILPIAYLKADSAINIMPEHASLGGVSRAYVNEMRDVAEEQVNKVAKAVEDLSGCKVNVKYTRGYSPVINDAELTDTCMAAITDAIGSDRLVVLDEPLGFSEDFSAYSESSGKPGVLLLLKAGNAGTYGPLHNPACSFREEAMPYGMATMVAAAMKYLNA